MPTDAITAAHILLSHRDAPRGNAARSRDEARSEADDILRRIKEGEDFESLARRFSDCPSCQEGGNLGRFGRGTMVPAFEDAAFALDVNQNSSVVETPFGYHIIRRLE